MVPLLLLPLLCPGSLQQQPGYQYELRVQESVTVQEGLCVHVPCSFYPWDSWSSSSELYTYWYQHGDDTAYDAPVASNNPHKPVKSETENRFIFKDPKTNNCSLSIRDARRSDTGRYFFRVERGDSVKHSYREKMLNLQVTALTDKPHIQILEPLVSSHPTQLACSLPGACERGQRFTFSWAGAAVDSLDPQTLHSFKLTFTPRPGDHGTNLTCQVQVQRPQLTTQRTIRLDVSLKARRRQAAGRPKVTNDEDPVMGTVTLGSQKNLQPDGPPDQAPPAEKGPLSGEQQELYYANLTFEGLKPREPRGQEATSTQEYAVVKRRGQ
ncbi:sialic acid-binding Ig-like lectin 5 [Myotis lucifugus]|uniref:sialic acid-binding Ig-like lectin 5 n=1 Tax=Myotis lucifugus TaxID=59463 RepID=UPI000CCC5A21|nr:sialic acid-binding Ig-like lectin 5 [Myotis lucifugus]